MTEPDELSERLAGLAVPESDALRSTHTHALARARFLQTPSPTSLACSSLFRWLEPALLAFVMFVYLSWSVSALAALQRFDSHTLGAAISGK